MKTFRPFVRFGFGAALFILVLAPFGAGVDRLPDGEDCLPKDPPPPVVKVKVRVPACSEPGSAITYCICIENCSKMEAHHVVVKNALPANAKFVKSDPEPSKQGPELQWNLGTVGGGAVREIKLTLQPTNKEDVKNCVRVVFEHGVCLVTRQTGFGSRPPGVVPVPEMPKAGDWPVFDLKVHGPAEQYTNLASKYDIILTNKGKVKATNTQVVVRLPEQLKVVNTSEPSAKLDNVVVFGLRDLEPGASKLVQVTLKATEKGEHCFRIIAEADHGVRKEMDACTKFSGISALSVEMVDRVDPVFLNEKTSYVVTIRSVGGEAVTNTELRAFIPAELKLERTNVAFDEVPPIKEGKAGKWIKFKTLPKIDAGTQARYEIFVEAVEAGVTYFHIEVVADQLDSGRPVIEQESTTIVDDREKAKKL